MRVAVLVGLLIVLQALPSIAQRPEALYYAVNEEESIESFRANIRFIDIVGPQVYKVDSAGHFSGSVDPRMLALSKQHKVKVMPLMINTGFDQPGFHALLMNPKSQARAVQTMLALCQQHGFYGMQFDFENILVTDKDAFTAFYQKAAQALHANGFAISIAVVPRINDDPGPTSYHQWIYKYWRGVYDYKALAEAGDFISFMTYDQHTNLTPPGPVAGMPWMVQCIEFVLKSVPAEKISIGFPFYSTHWYPYAKNDTEQHTWGRQWSYPEAKAIAEKHRATIRWDEREQVNYTVFTNEALNEHIYFEDARSLRSKLDLLRQYKFRGFSIWRLGNEDPEVWKILANSAR